MSRPHVKFVREVKRYAERCGFEKVSVDYRRAHPVIRGVVNGAPVRIVIPKTPGDWRSRHNTYADLRRIARGGQL